MHSHFPLSVPQVLWTLTFAAHLVLLVVLMGRDRIARFKWFTASIVLVALRLLTSQLLVGRMPQLTMSAIVIVLADVGCLIGLMVILELARKVFGRVPRSTWVTGALVCMGIAAAVLAFWGKWPAWKTLAANSTMSVLQLLQLIAQKASLLVDVETIIVGLLIVILGRRFGAGWRSHVQRIAIGLSTASIAQLAMQGIWDGIARKAVAHTMAEYEHILGIREKLFNANSVIYVSVLIWWIVSLWSDEPGSKAAATDAAEPVGTGPATAGDAAELPAEE